MTATAILTELSARGVHLWAEADRLKFEAPAGTLTDDDRAALRAHKAELLALLSTPGRCPQCGDRMNPSDRTRDAWYCPGCRTWADSRGQPLPKHDRVRPLTLEDQQARKLLADLLAAGCGFVLGGEFGDELRIIYPTRIDAGLWTRYQASGAEFRALARAEAERQAQEWEGEAGQWIN